MTSTLQRARRRLIFCIGMFIGVLILTPLLIAMTWDSFLRVQRAEPDYPSLPGADNCLAIRIRGFGIGNGMICVHSVRQSNTRVGDSPNLEALPLPPSGWRANNVASPHDAALRQLFGFWWLNKSYKDVNQDIYVFDLDKTEFGIPILSLVFPFGLAVLLAAWKVYRLTVALQPTRGFPVKVDTAKN